MNNYIIFYLSGIVPALVLFLTLAKDQRIIRGVDVVLLIALGLMWPVSVPVVIICFLEFENPFYKKEI
jgi:hypothetical protein